MGHNTIYVNSAYRIVERMVKSAAAPAGGASFSNYMQAASQDALSAYRSSIEDRISLIPIDTTRVTDDLFIDISDDGLRAMQADPTYEAWVLDTIRTQLQTPDPFSSMAGGNAVHFRFGATPAEFRADSGRKGGMPEMGELTGNGKKKSYWEERADRQEQNRALDDKIADARARARAASEIKRIQGEKTTGADDASAASEIITLLLATYMQGMS